MAIFKIEKQKGKQVKVCKLISTPHFEVMVGSGYCVNKCSWCKSHTKEEVDCGFKRIWK